MRLPDFLVIGGQRCATSWIQARLREHPAIYMPRDEIHFFSDRYRKGLDWYAEWFEGASPGQIVGEKSPSYLWKEGVPGRIDESLSDVRFVVNLRDPVERAHSQYKLLSRSGEVDRPFRDVLEEDTSYLEKGLYHKHLERYFRHFDRDRFLILFHEQLKDDPLGFIRTVYDFLGVDSDFEPTWQQTRNRGIAGRDVLLRTYSNLLQVPAVGPVVRAAAETARSFPPVERAIETYLSRYDSGVEPDLEERLRDYFDEPNRKLRRLLDDDAVDRWGAKP